MWTPSCACSTLRIDPVQGLYAIGDCAAFCLDPAGKPLGATAQAAQQQAQLLARSLARQLRGRTALPFRFRYKGTLVSLGEGEAVGDLPAPVGGGAGLKISGVGAKLAYTGLYQAHLAELFGWPRTLRPDVERPSSPLRTAIP